ncbi:MAG TPA: PEP-CTERM sorting domain-containing protein [Phycisphaerae bacterium]|nr:PEP-CTERM sorting domain-containing protein [Phycisphaerae bacterium]
MSCRIPSSLCVPVVLGLLAATVAGQTLTWDGQIDSNWYNPVNWDPNAFPADDANRMVLSGSPTASTDVRVSNGGSITLHGLLTSASFLEDLTIGHTGGGTLTIEAGGQVSNSFGYLGYESGCTGTATVTAAGSTWTNSGGLWVGRDGSGTLTIEAGGQVSNTYGYLGYSSGSTGTATVTGAGSTWTNSDYLHVGNAGGGTLTIEAGGQVSSDSCCLGWYSGSTGTGTVTGPGSTWTNSGGLYVGNYYGSGTLTIEAGGKVSNSFGYLGYNSGSTGTATVTGAGSTWTNSGGLWVGNFGGGTLTIEAGGQVSSLSGYLGYESGCTGTGTVTGAGSTWTNSGGLWVGRYGSGTLNIEAGGKVSNTDGYLGSNPGSTGTATVTGAGSTWTNSGSLYVGNYYGSGTLTIEAGGQVSSLSGYLGRDYGSTGTVTVTGAGSTWINSGDLWVGRYGGGMLTIEAGGQVSNSSGNLGYYSGTGTATVTGSGSTWTNSGSLYVGGYSGSGTLTIEAGGQVSSLSGYLGRSSDPTATGTATVTGPGSTWTNSGDLYVGRHGNGTLTVADGGQVSAGTLYASLGDLLGDGTVEVRGVVIDANLVFDATHGTQQTLTFGTGGELRLNLDGTGELGVGYRGSGTLTIADGVSVASSSGYLGYNSGSTGTGTVTGAGSTWTNSGRLYVGDSGSGTLTIEAGGQVSNTDAYLGYESGCTGTATLDGAGSTWTNSGDLYVGREGRGTLAITAGGSVSNGHGYLGCLPASTGTVTVQGADSTWANTRSLYVGGSDGAAGGTGTVTVSDGGLLDVGGTLKLWPQGTLDLQGGRLDADTVDLRNAGTFHFTGGELHVGKFLGDLANDGGAICPGCSIGLMDVDGNLAMNAGSIEIELAGCGAAALCDTVTVAGDVALGGSLELAWLPAAGDPDCRFGGSYTVLTWAGQRSEQFASVGGQLAAYLDSSAFPDGIEYDDANGLLRVHLYDLLVGDCDLDGIVGGDDLSILEAGFGSADAGWFDGDLNFDRSVDHLDYLLWKASAGQAVPGAGIPEPATLALLAVGGLAVVRRRRR